MDALKGLPEATVIRDPSDLEAYLRDESHVRGVLPLAAVKPHGPAALRELVVGDGAVTAPQLPPLDAADYVRLYDALLEPAFRAAGGLGATHAAVVSVLRKLSVGSGGPAAGVKEARGRHVRLQLLRPRLR